MKGSSKTINEEFYNKVVTGGYCIGCGACTYPNDSALQIKMNQYGIYQAVKIKEFENSADDLSKICPFSDNAKNETELGNIIFPKNQKSDFIGNFLANFAGHVVDSDYRFLGSSGGVAKWIGAQLLERKEVDYFVQIVASDSGEPADVLFDFKIFNDSAQILKGSKSAYYPITFQGILQKIKQLEGTFAITGIPCYIKSIRLLAENYPELKNKLKYTIGIVCGGMKSANQAKMIGWEMGVHPDNLVKIDFRRKDNHKSARSKVYQVWSNKDQVERYKFAHDIFGTDYGVGFFKPKACDYCDDVVGELADVSIGDAWLPQWVNDSDGNSLVIVRNNKILEIIEEGIKGNTLNFKTITEEEAIKSQDAGFRHRREGLAYRLYKKERRKEWAPQKRVAPSNDISAQRRKIYNLREEIAEKSHIAAYEALKRNNYKIYYRKLFLISSIYYGVRDNTSFLKLCLKISKKIVKNVVKK